MNRFINANETISPQGDWETVTAAIRLACEDGCRAVKIPRYNVRTGKTKWSFSRAIQLPSDFKLYLDNCFLEQGKDSFENLIVNEHMYDGTWLNDPEHVVKNISIIGEGHVVLSGGEHNHALEKTVGFYQLPDDMFRQNLLRFWNVNGLTVTGITLKDFRWWAIVHAYVRNAFYKNIHFEAYPRVPNLDGFDVRLGCHHFRLENFTGKTEDDVIAFTGLKAEDEMAMKVEGLSDDIHDITVRNEKAFSQHCFLVRLLNHDGCREYNIDLDTIMDASDPNVFRPWIGVGIGSPFYFAKHKAAHGDTYNIKLKNLYTRAHYCLKICHTCADSTFTNIHTYDGTSCILHSEVDGMDLENVELRHVFYEFEQPQYPNGETVEPEKYQGRLLVLPNTRGDMSICHVETDPIGTGIRVSGGVKVKLEDLRMDAVTPVVCDGDSEVTEDGVKIS